MIHLIERALLALACLLTLAVGTGTAAVSILFDGIRSGVPPNAIASELATQDWLARERERRGLRPHVTPLVPLPPDSALHHPHERPAFERAVRALIRSTTPARPEAGGARVPGVPWLRREPGVRYQPKRVVPRLVYRQLRTAAGSATEIQRGGGRFVQTDHGDAYQLDWVAPKSHMARAGLQPRDQILGVNGLPLSPGAGAARALFEQLRGQRRFTILVLRNGRRIVIPFEVSN